MNKFEFENLSGRSVTEEQYKAIEILYMSSDLGKAEFVRDHSGFIKTPNGCYFHIKYVEVLDIDIKTGKYIIKPLEDKDFEQLVKEGKSLSLSTWFDFNFEDCIDENKKPIELNY